MGSDNNKRKQFEWDMLVPHLVHPIKVAIIGAMQWIEEPVSPRELDRIFDEKHGVSLIAYHMRTLLDMGVVEQVRQRPVRGAVESFYVLVAREPADSPLACE